MHPDTHPGPVMDVGKRYVRITGAHDGFVEFDFAIGDPDITVELILPRTAFDEFCRANQAVQLQTMTHNSPQQTRTTSEEMT